MLRSSAVDHEILISCDMLIKWDSTFGKETVTDFMHWNLMTHYNSNKKIKNVNSSQLYNKSKVPTDQLSENIPSECIKLREKILRSHKKNFKEKLGPLDRIKHEPVKLKIDKTRGIRPVKNTKAYDIPLHLRIAATMNSTR